MLVTELFISVDLKMLTRNGEEMTRSLGLLKAPSRIQPLKSLLLDFLLQGMQKFITCVLLSGKKMTNYKKTNAEWKFFMQFLINFLVSSNSLDFYQAIVLCNDQYYA